MPLRRVPLRDNDLVGQPGAPGGLGISIAPSMGKEQGRNLEDSLEEAQGSLLFEE